MAPRIRPPRIFGWPRRVVRSARHGLVVDTPLVETSAATPALLSGSVDALQVSAAAVITADASGADFVFIASALNHSTFSLMAKPEIHSASDLKGKVVASDRPGTAVDYGTQLMLSLLHLQPSDVSILPLTGSGLLAALESAQADAATMSPPDTFQASSDGFVPLINTYDQPYQHLGLVVRRSRIPELRPALIDLVAAYRDGIAAYDDDPTLALQTLQKYSQGNPDVLPQTYDFYKTQAPFQQDLQPTLAGTQAMIDFLASTSVPQAQGTHAEQYWDTSLLDALPPS